MTATINPTVHAPTAPAASPSPKSATVAKDPAELAKAAPKSGTSMSISSAGQAAAQEAAETPAQTAREAQSGDVQAKRVMAREAATRKAYS